MDPYIEGQRWPDFHLRLIAKISEQLVPSLRPHYIVLAEDRIYLERDPDGRQPFIRPDLLVARSTDSGAIRSGGIATAPAEAPIEITLPMPQEVKEHYLSILDRETRAVVTIIEVLSPGNKRPGSDGRTEYLSKRDRVLVSMTNLVELDLLRGGMRLPADQQLPTGDFFAIVSRGRLRPAAQAYRWTVRESMPAIPIPLAGRDSDVTLDLQPAFSAAYDGGGYDYSLDYSQPIEPPLPDADAAWAQEVLQSGD